MLLKILDSGAGLSLRRTAILLKPTLYLTLPHVTSVHHQTAPLVLNMLTLTSVVAKITDIIFKLSGKKPVS